MGESGVAQEGGEEMNIYNIIREYMEKRGYTALYCDSCGCSLDDLMPCHGEYVTDCVVGWANDCALCARREDCDIRSSDVDWMCRDRICYVAPEEGDVV